MYGTVFVNHYTAKYSIAQSKVDVESLRSCLMAYDLKQQGLRVSEIGLQVKCVSTAEAKHSYQTHKLLNKAKADVEAGEKGTFGAGH